MGEKLDSAVTWAEENPGKTSLIFWGGLVVISLGVTYSIAAFAGRAAGKAAAEELSKRIVAIAN